jgi:hypothetical protein
MKNYIIAVLALSGGLGLALSLPATAEKGKGPCAEDVAKFCKDVKPGKGNIAACLKEHEKELSKACSERKAKAGEKRGNRGDKAGKRGGDKAWTSAYGKGFTAGFKRGYGMQGDKPGKRGARAGKRGDKNNVCAADTQKLCKDVKPGEGRVRDCLIKNAGKLSDDCKARTEKMKVKLEEKGKKV